MSELERLYSLGMISAREMRRAAMREEITAPNEDGGAGKLRGAVRSDHVIDPRLQRAHTPGLFTEGGKQAGQADFGPSDHATRGHIDKSANHRPFPPGSRYTNEQTGIDRPTRA